MESLRQGAAGILPAVLFSDWSAGKMPAALWGAWLDAGQTTLCYRIVACSFCLNCSTSFSCSVLISASVNVRSA